VASPGINRFSIAYCLGALALTYISAPFVENVRHGMFIEAVLVTLVLLASVLAVGHNHRVLVWGVVLAVPAFVIKWIHYVWPYPVFHRFYFLCTIVFCLFVMAQLFRFVFRAKRVDAEVLCAAIAAYLLLALIWSFVYILTAEMVPGAFAYTTGHASGWTMGSFSALYFSFSTLNTVGYGDIVPAADIARMFAMTEATFGMFYMALMISRLVSLYSSQAHTKA